MKTAKDLKRVVVKIGSNVLTRADGTLNITRLSSIVDQIVFLRYRQVEVILISSGAVASGRSEMHDIMPGNVRLDSVQQRQLFSAVGQAKLINRYYELFREHHIAVGQVLTMKESFSTRRHYLNQRECLETMLQCGVIPIVNENDTISVTELMFTDNDELSGLISTMLGADALIILSNIDGLMTAAPTDSAAELIHSVSPTDTVEHYISSEHSGFGRGGMATKCGIAQRVAREGVKVIIANGLRDNILLQLYLHPDQTPHTEFTPVPECPTATKRWLAHSTGFAKGKILVNDNATAERAFCRKSVTLF